MSKHKDVNLQAGDKINLYDNFIRVGEKIKIKKKNKKKRKKKKL